MACKLTIIITSRCIQEKEQGYWKLIKWRNRFLLPSSMVVRLHKKCNYSGLIFSVAFVACACVGYLSKFCPLQVQRLQVALPLSSILYFPWYGLNHKGPNINKWTMDCWYTSFSSSTAHLSFSYFDFIAISIQKQTPSTFSSLLNFLHSIELLTWLGGTNRDGFDKHWQSEK